MRKQLYMFEIMVPCVMNDHPVRTKHHKQWDVYVQSITGGITILKPAKGKWVAPNGQLFAERMIPVMLACTENQIETIVQFTLKHYNQLAVLYFKLGEAKIVYKK